MDEPTLDAVTAKFATSIASRETSSGIPPRPSVTVNETTLRTLPFKFDLTQPGGGGGGGTTPPLPPEYFVLMEDDYYVLAETYWGILMEDQSG